MQNKQSAESKQCKGQGQVEVQHQVAHVEGHGLDPIQIGAMAREHIVEHNVQGGLKNFENKFY